MLNGNCDSKKKEEDQKLQNGESRLRKDVRKKKMTNDKQLFCKKKKSQQFFLKKLNPFLKKLLELINFFKSTFLWTTEMTKFEFM